MANIIAGATVLNVSSAAKNNYPGTGAFPGQQNLMPLLKSWLAEAWKGRNPLAFGEGRIGIPRPGTESCLFEVLTDKLAGHEANSRGSEHFAFLPLS